MTTITYRDGVLASDSLLSGNHLRFGNVEKIWRLPDGSLFGAADVSLVTSEMRDWVGGGMVPSEMPVVADQDLPSAIWIKPDGVVYRFFRSFHPEQVAAPFHAIGTGAELAIGAMAVGADAVNAVKVAIAFDIGTGGHIQVFHLDPSTAPAAQP